MPPLPTSISRRHLLRAGGVLAGMAALPLLARGNADAGRALGPAAEPGAGRLIEADFTAAERMTALPCFDGHKLPLWTFTEDPYPPVIRMALGDTLEARVANALPGEEHLTVHWHGLRIANDQDGVPFLTQPPIEKGERFIYRFTPPDTGTFFFHTHCNTVTSLGRGLAGILIVEGDETEPYDADETIVLKDWRLNAAGGGFDDFYTPAGAARAGTFGSVRSANGAVNPAIEVPAGADVRLRILNVDATRTVGLGVRGAAADAAVIAIDGCGVAPFPSRYMLLGAAQRVDMVVRTPGEGGIVEIIDFRLSEPKVLAHLRAVGPKRRGTPFDPAPLTAPRMAAPDLDNATMLPFELASSPLGAAVTEWGSGSLCTPGATFWSINKTSWPGLAESRESLPPPIATLERGRTYVFELANISKQSHPMHLHGHSFEVIETLKSELPVHRADTVMLVPRERARIAFVADNPGDWMFHCHIIEHQETGMMSYVRVA